MTENNTLQVAGGAPEQRLTHLHQAYADAKAKADAAAAELKVITDGIKVELSQLALQNAGVTRVELATPGATPLRMSWVESMRFDSVALKKADPATYVQYAKKSGYWELKTAKVAD